MADPKFREMISKKNKLWMKKHPEIVARLVASNNDPEVQKRRAANLRKSYASGKVKPHGLGYITHSWVKTKKGGGRMFCNSSWEVAFVKILDSSKIVKEFVREPFPIPYKFKGVKHTFFPDFLVELKDGGKFVVEIKGQYTAKDKAKFKAAAKFCKKNKYEWAAIFEKPTKPLTEYLQ